MRYVLKSTAWLLNFVFWLPILTFYLIRGWIAEEDKRDDLLMLAVIAWILLLVPLAVKLPTSSGLSWWEFIRFDGLLHYWVGLLVCLKFGFPTRNFEQTRTVED